MSGPQVCDDMTVEVALSVMVGARVGSLFLCDRDEQVTGSITRTRLVAVRDSSAYTDRLRLRDVLRADRPSAPSVLAGDHGPALGALALSR